METHTIIINGRLVRITNCTPVLTPEQREKRKREIELVLYDVFKKYARKPE